MTRQALPQGTLVAVDRRASLLGAQPLERSMAGMDFAEARLFAHSWPPHLPPSGIAIIDIDPITSARGYLHLDARLMNS